MALLWFQSASNLVGQQARWLDLLGEFNFVVDYRPGYKYGDADAFSRRRSRSCLFCRQPRETECMATFTRPETRPDSEDRWATSRFERRRARTGI